MAKYAMEREMYYMECKDFLYSKIKNNPELKNSTVDELADIALAEKWGVFLPSGIRRTVTEKAAQRVLYMTNQENSNG